jgi:hypothetical protein
MAPKPFAPPAFVELKILSSFVIISGAEGCDPSLPAKPCNVNIGWLAHTEEVRSSKINENNGDNIRLFLLKIFKKGSP